MSTDVEVLLGRLARSWDSSAPPITLDEVQRDPSGSIDGADGADHSQGRARGRRWLAAACGLLILGLTSALMMIDPDDEDVPVVTVETTTHPSTTTSPPSTTAPTTIPIESFGDGAWWPVGPPVASCSMCTGIMLDDGRVAIAPGGLDDRAVVQLFDPTTASFSVGATLPVGDFFSSMIQLDDGRVLLTGENGAIVTADLGEGSVELVRERGDPTAAIQLADGRLLLFGPSSASELDLATNRIAPIADSLSGARAGAPTALVELDDGEVLVADHIESHIFDVASGAFRPFGDGTIRISWVRRLDGRRFLVALAPSVDGTRSDAEPQIYDHSTETFTDVGDWVLPVIAGNGVVAAAVLPDGRVFVVEQPTRLGDPSPGAAIHDLASGTVQEIAVPTGNRRWAQPIALPDGRVLIVGDYCCNGGGLTADDDTAELFAIGDSPVPDGCCPPNAEDVVIQTELTGESLTPLVGQPLRLLVDVPAGALVGALEAFSTAYEDRDGTGGTGSGGELSLPAACDQGCTLAAALELTTTPETTTLAAIVTIVYESEPPSAAERISVTIEPRP